MHYGRIKSIKHTLINPLLTTHLHWNAQNTKKLYNKNIHLQWFINRKWVMYVHTGFWKTHTLFFKLFYLKNSLDNWKHKFKVQTYFHQNTQ